MMIVLQLQVEQSGEFLMYRYETPKLLHQGSCIACGLFLPQLLVKSTLMHGEGALIAGGAEGVFVL